MIFVHHTYKYTKCETNQIQDMCVKLLRQKPGPESKHGLYVGSVNEYVRFCNIV